MSVLPNRTIPRSANQIYNLREFQKREIYAQDSDANSQDRFGFNALGLANSVGTPYSEPVQSVIGFRDWEMYFDTVFLTAPSNLDNGEIVFNIADINNGRDIGNVIEVHIGPIFFPIPAQSAAQPNFYFYRRVYMSIAALPTTQAVRASNGNVYHFEYEVNNLTSIAVLLDPIKESFFLQTPLVNINEIRMHFTVGPYFTPIPIPRALVQVISVAGSNPAQFRITTPGVTTSIIGPTGAQPAPGVAVFFTLFDPVPAVNSTQGQYVTDIDVDGVTFTVGAFNFTAVGAFPANMVIGKNRIAIPMRFTTVENKNTNYITVNHQ